LPPAISLVFCSSYSTLKMEVMCSSEALVSFRWTTVIIFQKIVLFRMTRGWCRNIQEHTGTGSV
jgi:hypothetical protein